MSITIKIIEEGTKKKEMTYDAVVELVSGRAEGDNRIRIVVMRGNLDIFRKHPLITQNE